MRTNPPYALLPYVRPTCRETLLAIEDQFLASTTGPIDDWGEDPDPLDF